VTYLPTSLKAIAVLAALYASAAYGTERTKRSPSYLYAAIPGAIAAISGGAGAYLTKRQPKQSQDLDLIGELSKFYALNGDEKGLAIVSTLVVHTQGGRSANP
jgi:hypothetical protein